MTSTLTPSTHRASFAIGNEQTAKRVVDLLTESFFEGQAAIAAFEGPGGRWDITVHFAEAPDQASIRELVGIAAGGEVAQDIAFDTVEAKDWVKATLEELVPVRAGRFIVHGRHDRAKVPPNKLGIEIEAALAFGTGHHGTTRGCLLAARSRAEGVSPAARARPRHRHRRAGDIGGEGAADQGAGERHRSALGPGGARQCAAQRHGGSGGDHPRHRIFRAGIRATRTVRSGAGEHSRQSVAANGNADGAASGAIGVGHSVGLAAASGAKRDRRLSRARTCPRNGRSGSKAGAACCCARRGDGFVASSFRDGPKDQTSM